MTKQNTVPNIFINGEHLGGCDDLINGFRNGKVKKLLEKVTTQPKLRGPIDYGSPSYKSPNDVYAHERSPSTLSHQGSVGMRKLSTNVQNEILNPVSIHNGVRYEERPPLSYTKPTYDTSGVTGKVGTWDPNSLPPPNRSKFKYYCTRC